MAGTKFGNFKTAEEAALAVARKFAQESAEKVKAAEAAAAGGHGGGGGGGSSGELASC